MQDDGVERPDSGAVSIAAGPFPAGGDVLWAAETPA